MEDSAEANLPIQSEAAPEQQVMEDARNYVLKLLQLEDLTEEDKEALNRVAKKNALRAQKEFIESQNADPISMIDKKIDNVIKDLREKGNNDDAQKYKSVKDVLNKRVLEWRDQVNAAKRQAIQSGIPITDLTAASSVNSNAVALGERTFGSDTFVSDAARTQFYRKFGIVSSEKGEIRDLNALPDNPDNPGGYKTKNGEDVNIEVPTNVPDVRWVYHRGPNYTQESFVFNPKAIVKAVAAHKPIVTGSAK